MPHSGSWPQPSHPLGGERNRTNTCFNDPDDKWASAIYRKIEESFCNSLSQLPCSILSWSLFFAEGNPLLFWYWCMSERIDDSPVKWHYVFQHLYAKRQYYCKHNYSGCIELLMPLKFEYLITICSWSEFCRPDDHTLVAVYRFKFTLFFAVGLILCFSICYDLDPDILTQEVSACRNCSWRHCLNSQTAVIS